MIDTTEIAQIAAGLSKSARAILFELDEYWGKGPGHMSTALSIPSIEAREAFRELRTEGCCDFGCLIDEDTGELRGRGYWIDRFGLAVRVYLETTP
ncbi:hypothetical protein [Sphingomonas sp. KC8]|uniref:hypothetical protein n=1 Tax=Sphingomonas sp. KC8 TaxID=1030157 RepID=UPI0002489392|nr:hypothetical protein [Sphingomonas sp. KC8]ARS29049.1 hypothetical protein KC8_17405 [Sphingomonas sp. KC8]